MTVLKKESRQVSDYICDMGLEYGNSNKVSTGHNLEVLQGVLRIDDSFNIVNADKFLQALGLVETQMRVKLMVQN